MMHEFQRHRVLGDSMHNKSLEDQRKRTKRVASGQQRTIMRLRDRVGLATREDYWKDVKVKPKKKGTPSK